MRPSAWAGPVCDRDKVRELVANQGQGTVEQVRDEYLFASHSGRYRPVASIDHFEEEQVLDDVQAGGPWTFLCNHAGFRRAVAVEHRGPPSLPSKLADIGR